MSGPAIEDDEDALYNPCKIPDDDLWMPDPKVIAELYEKIDCDGVLDLQWRCPGRVSSQEQLSQQSEAEVIHETPEAEIKLHEKQKLVSMFDADDLASKAVTPTALSKTPKTPKTSVKVKASFDKIFNKISSQTHN